MKNIIPAAVLLLLIMSSCKSKPSDADIKKKILFEYVCNENAAVNNLQILNTKDAVAIFGNKGFEYEVSGEVEWKNGCREFGTNIQPGFTEKFERKTVFLIKGEDGLWY
ncbi:MAG: hypothetical protein WCF67_05450 [Chitinophagaceae bacterium]